ncbi:MAG TPA: hypothetical protein P5119_06775 [Candidatus Aminicenantes bacterium]|nr:hypothetical protein [Candidatus Aminicenantes bacterium]HRY65032.1 hypothetical protein [Candidatus Aminicenantes bacterium]HRZ71945.1 hypothetical protein [Candidatus Aminicenantes bacterium]
MNSSPEDSIELLKLFVERVEKLDGSSYIKTIRENHLKLSIKASFVDRTIRFTNSAPNSEYLDAFLFTLRLFMQKKDSISIVKTADMIEALNVSQEAKDRFFRQQNFLDKFLEEPSMIMIDGRAINNNELLETILYGYRGHLKISQPLYKQYKEWAANPIATNIVGFAFNNVLVTYFEALCVMAGNCRLMLAELQAKTEAG